MVEGLPSFHVPSSLETPISHPPASPDLPDLQHSLSADSADFRSHFIATHENAFRHPGPTATSQYTPAKVTASFEDDTWSNKTVLCLDGGGVRGLSSLVILERLMEVIAACEQDTHPSATTSADSPLLEPEQAQVEMKRLSPAQTKTSNFLPCHYFDYIAGTSTGGLIAILLGRLRMSVSSVIKEYQDLSSRVFAEREGKHRSQIRSLLHKRNNKEDILVDKIVSLGSPGSNEEVERKEGERTRSERIFKSDATRCRTIVCSLRRNRKSGSMVPFLFRSYDRAVAVDDGSQLSSTKASDLPISDVVRATVRAQDSVKSVHLGDDKYRDAGIGLNNPSIQIYKEVVSIRQTPQDSTTFDPVGLFLSIGCGFPSSDPPKYSSEFADRDKVSHFSSKVQRALYAISESVHQSMEDLHKSSKPFSYYRFDVPDALNSIILDKWNDNPGPASTFSRIQDATKSYLDSQSCRDRLAECAKNLVDRRRKRSKDAQWESFAFGTKYWCELGNPCEHKKGSGKPFETRDELFNHLRLEHLLPPPDADHDIEIKKLIDQGRTHSD
jgi:hypothetical protein